MTEKEQEIRRDLEKAAKISMRMSENIISLIQKKIRKEDNTERLTAMILQSITSMLMACSVNLHMHQKGMTKEILNTFIEKTISDAMKMYEHGAVKIEISSKH